MTQKKFSTNMYFTGYLYLTEKSFPIFIFNRKKFSNIYVLKLGIIIFVYVWQENIKGFGWLRGMHKEGGG